MDDISGVADYVWPRVESTLQTIVDSVTDRNGGVSATILRLPSKRVPLVGYASFLTATGVSRDKEDIVIAVSCFEETGGIRCESDISIESEPTIDGPVAHFRSSEEGRLLESKVDTWIAQTQDFFLRYQDLVLKRLSDNQRK